MISREKSFGKGTFGLRHIVSFMQIMRLYPILTQKSGKGISLYYLMHNVHGLINRATPGIIHLIIMEWIVTLHQILSRIICRNNGLISNQGKGQSGYTPSHIRSRRSPVALMLADSIRHWYEKKEKIKERKKKEEKKKHKKKQAHCLSSFVRVAFNPNSRIKVENRDKRDGRSRARPCVENPRIPRVCVPHGRFNARLVTSTSF